MFEVNLNVEPRPGDHYFTLLRRAVHKIAITDMVVKLTPEKYLTYPMAPVHAIPCDDPVEQDSHSGSFAYKFKEGYIPHERLLIECLRYIRLETLDAGPDLEILANARDPIDRYCIPIQTVMNRVVLKKTVPEVQLLRGTVSNDGCTRFPAALFVLGRRILQPFGKSAPLQTSEWHSPLSRARRNGHDEHPLDWDKVNKCFVAVAFVTPGLIQRDMFVIDSNNRLPHIRGPAREALAGLMTLSHNTNAIYAVLTDELTSVILTFNQCEGNTSAPFLTVKLSTDVDLRLMIAACIHYAAATWGLARISSGGRSHPVQGALNEPSSFYRHDGTYQLAERKWLSDFDLYTMQRISEVWWSCHLWHQKAQEDALKKPIVSGSQISFEPGGFERRFGLLRSPYPTQHIPKETTDVLARWTSSKRLRSRILDDILGSSRDVVLTVTQPIRTGPRHYSQVFYGRIEGCDESFCIKLFDERFFPIPWADDPECVMGRPDTRLLALNFSEDLARREESVYDRLHELQGSLLPHCYGFHMFTLPDGWHCLGLIMEKIDGLTLGSAFPGYDEGTRTSVASTVSFVNKNFLFIENASQITQMRHAVRILRANGISQTDWHLSQILCPTRDEHDVDVVLIDFAFALMYMGDEGGLPMRDDLMEASDLFSYSLGVDEDLVEKLWLPPLDYEY